MFDAASFPIRVLLCIFFIFFSILKSKRFRLIFNQTQTNENVKKLIKFSVALFCNLIFAERIQTKKKKPKNLFKFDENVWAMVIIMVLIK